VVGSGAAGRIINVTVEEETEKLSSDLPGEGESKSATLLLAARVESSVLSIDSMAEGGVIGKRKVGLVKEAQHSEGRGRNHISTLAYPHNPLHATERPVYFLSCSLEQLFTVSLYLSSPNP
jgi:hypothetical protein